MKKKTGPKPKSPGVRAAQYVAQEQNTTLIIDSSTDGRIPSNSMSIKEHDFINANSFKKEYLTTNTLIRWLDEWQLWLKVQDTPCTLIDFWLDKGVTSEDIKNFRQNDPIFKERYDKIAEYVGRLWSSVSMGKIMPKGDWYTIRQYAPNYVKEWRQYNREEKEFIEKIKFALEQQDNIELKRELAEIISKSFIALDKGSNDKPTNLPDKTRESKAT